MKSLFGAVKGGKPDSAQTRTPTAAARVISVAKPEWRASEAIRFNYDVSSLPPGSSHRLNIAPAGTPTAVADHFTFETEAIFLKPPAGEGLAGPLPPGQYEARVYYLPQGSGYYQFVSAQPITVTGLKPGRLAASALLSDLSRGEVPFLASYRGKLLEIEGPFSESRTSGENISITIAAGETSGGNKGAIICLAPLSNDAALQEAAAMKKGQTVVAGGFVRRVDNYSKTATLQPCAASTNLDITFTGPDDKREAKPDAETKPQAPTGASAPGTATANASAAAPPPPPAPAPRPLSGQSGARPAPPPAPAAAGRDRAAGRQFAEIPKPPPAPRVDVPRRLSVASLRFPGGRPRSATQPYLADFVKEVTAKNKTSCEAPQAFQWDTSGWNGAQMMQTVQSVIDDLKEQGFAMKRLQKPYDNTLVVRVENPQEQVDPPLLLAFYVEDEKDLFLVACTTK